MMNHQIVIISVKQSENVSKFLQQLKLQHIPIRKLGFSKEHLMFEIDVQHLRALRKIRKRYAVKLTIRYKAPHKILQRDGTTLIGLLLLTIVPIILAQFIWRVEIDANTVELVDEMDNYLQSEMKITMPIFKRQFYSDRELRQQLMEHFRQFSWVHITKQGSRVTLTPQLAPKETISLKQSMNQHLIASNSGVITHFDIERGVRKVEPNMTVYKGDTLVSGVLMRDDEVFVVGAQGEVYADYWLETTFSIPKTIEMQVLDEINWDIEINWNQLASSWKEKSLTPLKSLIVHTPSRVFHNKTETISENDIEKVILPLLHEKMIRSLPLKSTIKSEKLLHVYADDDTVKGKVLYLVNENIATPLPIHQGE
ncbi:sporulation protein YqfD [Solibacillus sp. MA9]|uniref:Sporulation protein YqfD n=1 Tax=Solibacillus palustris TaxID=2908203 RepID=A0ABS9UAQ4_9BACL|nr:sporulation protein YqfD [Solibacillus sp. MA9]MCH7321070.1 sporulation protein YqfD [Solibacillus sp. MA9]